MAKILLGGMVTGVRGTVAGVTYSANKGGNYARAWYRSTNPRTPSQASRRAILSEFASRWRDLTAAQQAGWDTYAALPAQDLVDSLGQTYSASGFAWYCKINIQLQLVAGTQRDDAPTLARTGPPVHQITLFRTTASGLNSLVRYDVTDPDLTAIHGIAAAVVNSTGRQVGPAKRVYLKSEVPIPGRYLPFQPEVEAAFGNITLLQVIFIRSWIQDAQGQRSTTIEIRAQSQAT